MSILAGLLACYLHCAYATGVNISIGTKDLYKSEKENTWWEARRNCQTEHVMDLYIADEEPLSSVLGGFLNNDTSYWVGAMRYSTWIWTYDESPLYSYVGYSGQGSTPKDLPHNSVYECHLACKNRDRVFGLSGNKCYCRPETHAAANTSAGEMQCPGNLDEKCGDSTGMSVYTLEAEHFNFTPTQNGACGYVNGSMSVSLSHYRNCLRNRRRFACHPKPSQKSNCNENACVSPEENKQSWIEAYQNCSLVKLDNYVNTTKLLKEIPPGKKIWIGLAYKVSRKWINGNNAYGYEDYYPFLNSPVQMCLALKTSRTRKLHWLPCSLRLASICEGNSTTENRVSNDDGVDETDTQTGLTIGLGAGSGVLLLTVIAVVLFARRQRRIRLGRAATNQQNFNMSTEKATCAVPREDAEYSVINPDTINGQPSTSCVPKTTVNRNTEKCPVAEKDGKSLSAKVKGDAGLYDHTKEEEGHYDTAQGAGGASRSDESYSHIGVVKMGFEEGDYDVLNAGLVVKCLDDTYNHTYET